VKLSSAIARSGLSSPTWREHRELTEKLDGSEPRTIRLQLRDTRRFVEARVKNLQSMWTGEAQRKAGPTSRRGPGTCSEVWLLEWCRGPGMDRTSARSVRVAGGRVRNGRPHQAVGVKVLGWAMCFGQREEDEDGRYRSCLVDLNRPSREGWRVPVPLPFALGCLPEPIFRGSTGWTSQLRRIIVGA
jgi:hypothetical protein